MITPERLYQYKQQALKSIGAKARNPKAPGIACVVVAPHDLLTMIAAFERCVAEDTKSTYAEPPA